MDTSIGMADIYSDNWATNQYYLNYPGLLYYFYEKFKPMFTYDHKKHHN